MCVRLLSKCLCVKAVRYIHMYSVHTVSALVYNCDQRLKYCIIIIYSFAINIIFQVVYDMLLQGIIYLYAILLHLRYSVFSFVAIQMDLPFPGRLLLT